MKHVPWNIVIPITLLFVVIMTATGAFDDAAIRGR